jgi:hypothetical protein
MEELEERLKDSDIETTIPRKKKDDINTSNVQLEAYFKAKI